MPILHKQLSDLRLNPNSLNPAAAQISDQLYCMITIGQLVAGDVLPPIRKLAEQLDVNPNTVAKAYAGLERKGAIVKRQGSGCSVSSRSGARDPRHGINHLRGQIDDLVHNALSMGIGVDQLIEAIRRQAPGEVSQSNPARRRQATKQERATPAEKEPALWDSGSDLVD